MRSPRDLLRRLIAAAPSPADLGPGPPMPEGYDLCDYLDGCVAVVVGMGLHGQRDAELQRASDEYRQILDEHRAAEGLPPMPRRKWSEVAHQQAMNAADVPATEPPKPEC